MNVIQPGPGPSPEEGAALGSTAAKAAVAELAYTDGDGLLEARAVTPVLLEDGAVAFTLTYADAELARHLERRPDVCLTFSDSRLALAGWKPLSVSGRLGVTSDLEGELFADELMHQELRKHPPSRKLANSLLLRRENWWYLPRFVLRLTPTAEVRTVGRRKDPEDAVLIWAEEGGALRSETVSVSGELSEGTKVDLRSLAGTSLPPGPRSAAVFAHDFSVPDLEQRTSFLARGRLDADGDAPGGRFAVESVRGGRTLGGRPGLLARWREHRALERACRTAIEEAEAAAETGRG